MRRHKVQERLEIPLMLTREEAAKRFRVGKKTISNWICDGKLKAVKIGRRYLIPESELLRLLDPGNGNEQA